MKMKKQIILLLLACLLLAACAAPQPAASAPASVPEEAPKEPVEEAKETSVPDDQPVTLEKLEIASYPDKTSYYSGEAFDPAGLVINAVMSDGSVRENVPFTVELGNDPIPARMTSISVLCEGKKIMIKIDVIEAGNADEYSVANTETIENSPVKGNVYYWLGSSVTFGANSKEESMVDFFAKKYDCTCIKEAVSGTTLNASNTGSYVERFDRYLASEEKAEHLDGFICQLSTNDTRNPDALGLVMPDFVTGSDAFDTHTTFGAIEYIIAKVKETWDCPVYFYTNPPYSNGVYEKMVEGLQRIAEKWDITVIDMFADEAFNAISDSDRALYMSDTIHPTKAGYLKWWLPKFEEALLPAE